MTDPTPDPLSSSERKWLAEIAALTAERDEARAALAELDGQLARAMRHVGRVEERIDRLRTAIALANSERPSPTAERDKARSENDRLREALERISSEDFRGVLPEVIARGALSPKDGAGDPDA